MKMFFASVAVLGLLGGAALAQSSDKPMNNDKTSPGTTGAMSTPTAPAVATNPQEVQAQQGDSAKHSAGTVGAAPGAATASQTAGDQGSKMK